MSRERVLILGVRNEAVPDLPKATRRLPKVSPGLVRAGVKNEAGECEGVQGSNLFPSKLKCHLRLAH